MRRHAWIWIEELPAVSSPLGGRGYRIRRGDSRPLSPDLAPVRRENLRLSVVGAAEIQLLSRLLIEL